MTGSRSMFTEAIEDHLALQRQNAVLDHDLPLDRFRTADPLDRYPGGPVRPAVGGDAMTPLPAAPANDEPNQALAVDAPGFDAAFRKPVEPLGMTPMLSLVEDLDDVDGGDLFAENPGATMVAPAVGADQRPQVVRFPGGVGPRGTDHRATADPSMTTDLPALGADGGLATQDDDAPVIVIDVDEPLAPVAPPTARATTSADRAARRGGGGSLLKKLRRPRREADEPAGQGWFSGSPRDFHWDD